MSKSLEQVEIIKSRCITLKLNHKIGSRDIANQEVKDCVIAIEKCVNIIEKSLKALEIIKEKEVQIGGLYGIIMCPTLEIYNSKNTNKLTQEEFELVKEVLLWD